MNTWKKTPQVTALQLTDIGAPLRTTAPRRATNQISLPGSSKPGLMRKTRVGPDPEPIITIVPTPKDVRFDTSKAVEHFNAYPPGIDPTTGRSWTR